MTPEIIKLALENRELGFAVLVLVGLFFLLRPIVDKYIEWEGKRRENAEKRANEESRFLREMVHYQRMEGEARAADVEKLMNKFTDSMDHQTEVISEMCDAMKDVKKSVDSHEYMSKERFASLRVQSP